jgi:hypothetical protein
MQCRGHAEGERRGHPASRLPMVPPLDDPVHATGAHQAWDRPSRICHTLPCATSHVIALTFATQACTE